MFWKPVEVTRWNTVSIATTHCTSKAVGFLLLVNWKEELGKCFSFKTFTGVPPGAPILDLEVGDDDFLRQESDYGEGRGGFLFKGDALKLPVFQDLFGSWIKIRMDTVIMR